MSANEQLENALSDLKSLQDLMSSYDTTHELITKMQRDNEAKLTKCSAMLMGMVAKLRKLASTPGAKSRDNVSSFQQLSTGIRSVLAKSKTYPNWPSGAAGGKQSYRTPSPRGRGRPRSRARVNPTAPKSEPSGPVKEKVTTSLGSTTWREVGVDSNASKASPHSGADATSDKHDGNVDDDDDDDDGKDYGPLEELLTLHKLQQHMPVFREFGVDLKLLRMSSPSDVQELGLAYPVAKACIDAASGKPPECPLPETVPRLLQELHISEYESVFTDCDVSMSILRMAAAEDLKELGLDDSAVMAIVGRLSGKAPPPPTVAAFLNSIGRAELVSTFEDFGIGWNILSKASLDDLNELELPTGDVVAIFDALSYYAGTLASVAAAKKVVGSRNRGDSWIQRETSLSKPIDLGPFKVDFNELTIGVKIGEGGFATVHKGTWKGREVAIKVMKFKQMDAKGVSDFTRELSVLSQLKHPNITDFLAATTDPPNLTVVMEYVERGALSELLADTSLDIPWKSRIRVLKDVALGIHYLHSLTPKIIHRDLKAANVLVTEDWGAKVCDFGLSKMKTSAKMRRSVMLDPKKALYRRSVVAPSQQAMGTPAWAAPELLDNQAYSESVDTYSYGIFMWEVLTRKKPHANKSDYSIVMDVHMTNVRPSIPDWCPDHYRKLLESCWNKEHTERPTFASIISTLTDIQRGPVPELPL